MTFDLQIKWKFPHGTDIKYWTMEGLMNDSFISKAMDFTAVQALEWLKNIAINYDFVK